MTLPHWKQRPFRAPHHTATSAALAGGTTTPRPGEISLAHNGVLFLDELPEFQRGTLEVLREPLETGCISIARARGTTVFPARFQLIAAMNPCLCGYLGDAAHECRCTPDQVSRYRQRISGPFLDRLDICVYLHREPVRLSNKISQQENSAVIKKRVVVARRIMRQRGNLANAQLNAKGLHRYCWPDKDGQKLLESAADKLVLSRRACNRILKVARSIADLADSVDTQSQHIAEALNLRQGLQS
jgi:magnesium chelatase family protein